MTKTVQILRLVELLNSIGTKFANNPTFSQLLTDAVKASTEDGLTLTFADCAKRTALKALEADFAAYQDDTPTLENPVNIRIFDGQDGFKFFMFDSAEHSTSYLIPLKHITIDGVSYDIAGGHINVLTGDVTVTHVKEVLAPTDDWHKSNTYDGSFYVTRSIKKSNSEFLSNLSTCVDENDYAYGYACATNKNLNFWYAAEGTTTAEFKEWLATHPLEVSYELATPVTLHVDPVNVKTLNDTDCYILAHQNCVTDISGEYIRDLSAAIEAIENTPTLEVEINKEGVEPSENAETITIDDDTFAVNGVEINKTGVTPSETLSTLTQGDTTYSFTSDTIVETIMGNLDRTYGTTADNYIGTFSQWDAIDTGKSFADYDEIILVCKSQTSPVYGESIRTHSINVEILKHYDKVCEYYYSDGNNVNYVKFGLDYTNNKFYLENWNYVCPIALVGVKH